MASIILRNQSHGVSHSPRDSWLWSWDPLRALDAWMCANPQARPMTAPRVSPPSPRVSTSRKTRASTCSPRIFPGVKPEAVEISLDGDRLQVSGRREAIRKEESERTFLSECSYGSFSRLFTLPEGVDGEHVQASLKDGVLTLVLPKKPEAQPRKIPVAVTG